MRWYIQRAYIIRRMIGTVCVRDVSSVGSLDTLHATDGLVGSTRYTDGTCHPRDAIHRIAVREYQDALAVYTCRCAQRRYHRVVARQRRMQW